MSVYETLKLFDLAQAPANLREATELEPLRPSGPNREAGIVPLHVSRHGLFEDANDSQAVSLTEHLLYRWLLESGCDEGEKILLTWIESADRSLTQIDISAIGTTSTLN